MNEAMRPTERFSDRAGVYTRGRPTYPDALVAHLRSEGALPDGAVVVDIGVGTGLSAEPFLRAGCSVIGVEPNAAMRAVGDERLGATGRYRSVDGRAEATTLASAARSSSSPARPSTGSIPSAPAPKRAACSRRAAGPR